MSFTQPKLYIGWTYYVQMYGNDKEQSQVLWCHMDESYFCDFILTGFCHKMRAISNEGQS